MQKGEEEVLILIFFFFLVLFLVEEKKKNRFSCRSLYREPRRAFAVPYGCWWWSRVAERGGERRLFFALIFCV